MTQFDPVMNEHFRTNKNKEYQDDYLCKQIQNESIITLKTTDAIVDKSKRAKLLKAFCCHHGLYTEQLSIVM